MQRSLLLFENGIKSKNTFEKYVYFVKRFIKFYHLKNYDSITQIESSKLQIMIEDYVMDLKKRVNPNSVPTYITPLETFFEINDLEIKWKKIHRLYPAKIKATGKKAYTTKDIQKMLQGESKKRNIALIHVLASSGIRKGAVPDLKIKHLTKMPENCYAVLVYEDSTEEYYTFLTPEASNAVDVYLDDRRNAGELLDSSSPIFRKHYQIGIQKVKPITSKSLDDNMEDIVNRANVRVKVSKNRYDKMLDHAFRKRFETILKLNKDIPVAVSEKLIGHSSYYDDRGNHIQLDDNYVVPELEKLFDFFKLAIPELIISDQVRNSIKIQKLEDDNTELEKKTIMIKELEKRIDILELTKDKE